MHLNLPVLSCTIQVQQISLTTKDEPFVLKFGLPFFFFSPSFVYWFLIKTKKQTKTLYLGRNFNVLAFHLEI